MLSGSSSVMLRLFGLSALALGCGLGLALAACDSEPPAAPQAKPEASATAAGDGKTETYESEGGLVATLSRAHAGRQAPVAPFTGPDGKTTRLADFEGRPLLVNLWATWCAPCKAEMPTLAKLAAAAPNGLQVIAVSQDNASPSIAKAWLAEAKLPLAPYADASNALLLGLGGDVQLPTSILYDSAGREVWRMVGPLAWDDAEAAKLLAEAR